MKIAFIGLGKMGTGIAHNLIRAGHELHVYNRTVEKSQSLAEAGARVADSPADAARDIDAVFTMLSDDLAVTEVTLGPNGIASSLAPGAVHISISTISIGLSRHLADEHTRRDQKFITAPVFGRPEAAEKKLLIVVTAGEPAVTEKFLPVFDAIGRKTFIGGDEPWHANAIKLCGNFMIASMVETFAEAFATLRKGGVDHHRFLEVMNELFGSPVYKNYGQTIADQKFTPAGFELKLGLKDVRLVLELADRLAAPMPLASVVRDHFLAAVANGQEKMDWSSVSCIAARDAGLQ